MHYNPVDDSDRVTFEELDNDTKESINKYIRSWRLNYEASFKKAIQLRVRMSPEVCPYHTFFDGFTVGDLRAREQEIVKELKEKYSFHGQLYNFTVSIVPTCPICDQRIDLP